MVDFSLNGLTSKYRNFARSYLFECKITGFSSNHEYLVKSTKLPEQNIEMIEADLQGNKFKIAGNTEFPDFTIDFNMDDSDNLRYDFIEWANQIHNSESNDHGSPTFNGYFKDITLKHLDGKGNPILTYEMISAWPKNIGEVNLDYSTKEIATFSVTFAYQYHIVS